MIHLLGMFLFSGSLGATYTVKRAIKGKLDKTSIPDMTPPDKLPVLVPLDQQASVPVDSGEVAPVPVKSGEVAPVPVKSGEVAAIQEADLLEISVVPL